MQIQTLLNPEPVDLLTEMTMEDTSKIDAALKPFFYERGFRFTLSSHGRVDRLVSDSTRQNVSSDDIIGAIKALVIDNKPFNKIDFTKNEIEGVVTNYLNDLNVVFYCGRGEFRIITVMVSNDFKSGNRPDTRRFGVKV